MKKPVDIIHTLDSNLVAAMDALERSHYKDFISIGTRADSIKVLKDCLRRMQQYSGLLETVLKNYERDR